MMFENLKDHKHILVTGCQRSGTRFVARAICHDTGHTYVDETELAVELGPKMTNVDKLMFEMRWWNNLVFQAPQLSYMAGKIDDLFVVWVKRDAGEIRRSMQKIRWGCERMELANYGMTEGDIIAVKQNAFDAVKATIPCLEVNYADLKTHPLYVADRANFEWCQTK
jgi:hypothetical protein